MAGGFKLGQFSWVGVPTGADKAAQCRFMLENCVSALMSTDASWAIETSLGTDGYIDFSSSSTYPAFGVWVRNSALGVAVWMAYTWTQAQYAKESLPGYSASDALNSALDETGKNIMRVGGLSFAAMDNISFNDGGHNPESPLSSTFLHNAGTRIYGTAYFNLSKEESTSTSTTYAPHSYVKMNTSSTQIKYSFIVKGGVMFVVRSSGGDISGACVGHLCSGYEGWMGFYIGGKTYDETKTTLESFNTKKGVNDTSNPFGDSIEKSAKLTETGLTLCRSGDGGDDRDTAVCDASLSTGRSVIVACTTGIDKTFCNPLNSGCGRFAPYWVGYQMFSSDAKGVQGENYCDGFKGYLDTDAIRAVDTTAYTRGQTLDNGNFLYLGAGLCIGWDASLSTFNIF